MGTEPSPCDRIFDVDLWIESEHSARGRGQRVERPRVGGRFRFAEAHRREKRRAHLGGLPGLEDVALQVAAAERIAQEVGAREAVDEVLALGDRQCDRAVDRPGRGSPPSGPARP